MIFMVLIMLIGSPERTEDYAKHPPGMVKVADNLYADATEITESDWSEYTYYALNMPKLPQSSPVYQSGFYLPKTTITYEEAVAYCRWRTDFLNKAYYAEEGRKISVRLPTEEEFELLYDRESKHFIKDIKKAKKLVSEKDGDLLPVYTYGNPKKKRVYGLFHNAYEMSATRGTAFAGNNQKLDEIVNRLTKIDYNQKSAMVGFRCVAEFLE